MSVEGQSRADHQRESAAHVRFTPKSGQRADVLVCPLRATTGLAHLQQKDLLDDLVGASEERGRHCDTDQLRSL